MLDGGHHVPGRRIEDEDSPPRRGRPSRCCRRRPPRGRSRSASARGRGARRRPSFRSERAGRRRPSGRRAASPAASRPRRRRRGRRVGAASIPDEEIFSATTTRLTPGTRAEPGRSRRAALRGESRSTSPMWLIRNVSFFNFPYPPPIVHPRRGESVLELLRREPRRRRRHETVGDAMLRVAPERRCSPSSAAHDSTSVRIAPVPRRTATGIVSCSKKPSWTSRA